MTSFRDGLRSGIRGAFCRGLNADPQFIANLEDAFKGTLFEFSGDRLNQLFCDRPPGEFEGIDPPFEGGQCPGVAYNVTLAGQNVGFSQSFTEPGRIGPIGGICFIDIGSPTQKGLGIISSTNGIPTCTAVGQNLTTADQPTWSITAIARADGQPDTCGDPDRPLPAPGPVTINIDIEYGDNNEFSLTVPVIFAKVFVAFDGTLTIPFNIDELNLNGELSLNGDFEVTFNVGDNSPPNTGDDDPLPDPDPDGGDPDDDGENERGLIAGVFVVVTRLPTGRATFIPQSAGPSIIAPRSGSVKFKVSAGGRSGWTEDFPVKSSNAWIPVPGMLLATDVQVTPDFGAELSFRVVRTRPPLT